MEVKPEIKNAEKYAFEDFTHASYAAYIQQLKEQDFTFSFYHEFDKNEKFCLYRHDIDFSPMRALKLAKIEADLNVFSTFFIQPHCRFYHLLEKKIHGTLMEIKAMGHELALHFDFAFYPDINEKNIEAKLQVEKRLLEDFFATEIKVFSFHNPNQWALNWGVGESAGMINTYAEYFMEEVRYGSDSNGIWRNESFKEIISSNPNRLQLLTHPVWWTEQKTSPKERVLSCIEGRAKENLNSQLKVWEKWGRDFIDW